MNVWGSIILILAMSDVFAFGFYLMTKLDKFLDENRKAIEKETESRGLSYPALCLPIP